MAPAPHYPAELPIVARKDEILAALEANQVLVVAGETGSGKSTQLPKMCLEAGRGVAGLIGHTQPRRIAARSVAERVAEELGTTLGRAVGYKVRFTDRVSGSTLVKVMTDGVLLAELHGDPELRNYDTLIIDEAHERSLNIDFILGYLKRLLPSRPDLKVIVTSATIDTERFSQHFDGAPVIDVPGRTYPVEIRYRPMAEPGEDGNDEEPMDEVQAVCEAVADLCKDGPGDILVFLPGEREIRDTAEALAKAHVTGPGRPGFVRSPLFCRAAPDFRAPYRPARRPLHQCGRNLSHGARDPLCGRPRDGPYFALRPADKGPAAPHRADISGLGQPESGALRPSRPWSMRATLFRRGLRHPAALHRTRDIADEPGLGHPSDGGHRARGYRKFPIYGAT